MTESFLMIRHLFRALRYKNFRLFFIGQTVSLVGTWMQHVALAWLVYRLTRSPFWLGVVAFSAHIPTLIVAPLAGVLADRWNRHRLILIMQTLAMVQAAILAMLSYAGIITLWQVLVLAVALGVIHGLDIPARQSFFVELIGKKEDLGNAIALNSSMFNFARLAGPAVAGILIAARGEAVCFLLNAVSFLPLLVALSVMQFPKRQKKEETPTVFHGLKEGVRYIWGFPPIRVILLMLCLVGLFGIPHNVLMPVIASEVLHGGPHTLGFLLGSSGCGALAGAFLLASRKNVLGLEKLIAFAAVIFSLSLIGLAQSKLLPLSMFILFLGGFSLMVEMASSNTLLQTLVDDKLRGRVMSFYMISFMGTAPIGNLLAGSLASHIGAPQTIGLSGLLCFAGALLFARQLPFLKESIEPHYVKMGILPEVSTGLQTTTQLSSQAEE